MPNKELHDKPRLARFEESIEVLVRLAETSEPILVDDVESTKYALEQTLAAWGQSLTAVVENRPALAASHIHTEEGLRTLVAIVRHARSGH